MTAGGGPPPAALARAQKVVDAALGRLDAVETLENAYSAWLELKLEHASFFSRFADERKRLEEQGSFLVGAVRAAAAQGGAPGAPAAETDSGALARGGEGALDGYLREAEAKLAAARAALNAEQAASEPAFAEAFGRVRAEVKARVQRMAEQVKPAVHLMLRPLAGGRTILHVQRVGPDEAVLLLYALTGRIPSRYGYLFDDATDDPRLAPPPLYPDEGVAPGDTRPSPEALRRLLEGAPEVLPVKGFVPVWVPGAEGPAELYRLLQRGPVMEVELAEPHGFRSILSREEGEHFAGHLLRQKLAGRIALDVAAG